MTNPLPPSQRKNMPKLSIPKSDDEEAIKEAKKDNRIDAFFHKKGREEKKKKKTKRGRGRPQKLPISKTNVEQPGNKRKEDPPVALIDAERKRKDPPVASMDTGDPVVAKFYKKSSMLSVMEQLWR